MTVSNQTSVVQYPGNGSTTIWPTGFRFFKNTDLVVVKRSVSGTTTLLTLNTDYSVTGANALGGGSVTTTNPLTIGELLTIARVLTVQQLTDLRNQGNYFAEIHEDVFDYLTMLIQQVGESDSRSLRHPRDSEHYQAEARRIVDLEDPVDAQDATTKNWVSTYFGNLIDGATGLVNTATGILYDTGNLFDFLKTGNARAVDNITALRALSGVRNQRAFVYGYYAKGDGGGGEYYVDLADTVTADNGGSVIVGGDGSRWKIALTEAATVMQFGARANAGIDMSAALTANALVSDNVIIPPGQFRLSSSVTLAKGKAVTFMPGASITIDTGVTLTIRGKVTAGLSQIFFGAGIVAGIRQVYPEWWGALGDGTGDDQPALQAAHACIYTSGSSAGGRPRISLEGRSYQINSTWIISPSANVGMEIVGSGTVFSGSRITASATFASSVVVLVNGQTDSTQRVADWSLRDIGIVPSAGGKGSATIGLQIGNTSNLITLYGFQWNLVENVFVSNFATCFYVVHARLINFRRCSAWNDQATGSGNAAIRFKVSGSFTGDLRFDNCQFIANNLSGNFAVAFEANGGAFAGGNNQLAGIKFYGCDFYNGDVKVNMLAQAGSYLSDIWFIACQWDGPSNKDVYIESNNTGTLVDDIHFVDCFLAGGNLSAVPQVTVASTGTGGNIREIFFNNCIFESALNQSILVTDNGLNAVQGISIDSCTVRDNNFAAGACIQIRAQRVMINNNKANRFSTNVPKYFIQIDSGSVNYVVTSNLGAGIVATATLLDNGGAVNKVVANNL